MDRRRFFGAMAAVAATAVFDPERLLWRPGERTYFFIHQGHGWTTLHTGRSLVVDLAPPAGGVTYQGEYILIPAGVRAEFYEDGGQWRMYAVSNGSRKPVQVQTPFPVSARAARLTPVDGLIGMDVGVTRPAWRQLGAHVAFTND